MTRILGLSNGGRFLGRRSKLAASASRGAVMLFLVVPAFGSFISSSSSISLVSGTLSDGPHFGNTASSSISNQDIEVGIDGGMNYGAEAFSSGAFGTFSLFAFAGGSSTGNFVDVGFAAATTQVQFSDSLNVAGSGQGTIRLPFLVDGSVDVSGTAGSVLGFTFCQSIQTGSQIGGVGCTVNGLPAFLNSQLPNVFFTNVTQPGFSQVFNLDFPIIFGVSEDLNFTVTLTAGASGAGGLAGADFSHTGILQPVQVYDAFGNLISNPMITSQSGFDYVNPQVASAVPEPSSLILVATGLLAIVGRTRKRQKRAE